MSLEQIGLAAVLDMTDFNRNMSKYDAALDKMNKQTADAAGKVGGQFLDIGEKVNKAALVIGTAFVAATAAAGVALAKFTSDGIGKAADLEEQMGGIAAVMSKTKDEVAPLKDLILQLGIDPKLKVTTFEAADAIQMLARNGLTMTEVLDGAARSTVLLANATDADFGTAADIATDVMAIFNIKAADMSQAVDGITSVVNNSKFSIDDYRLALAQGGGVAGAVGVEFDDFNTSIAATAPLFASGSDAGTSFKVFLQRLVPDTDKAADTMMRLGLMTEDGSNAFFDASGRMKDMDEIAGLLQGALAGLSEEQQNQALKTLFGTDAMRTAVGLAKVGQEEFLALKKTMGNTSAEDAAATRMDNLRGAMEILQGVVETVQIKIGEKFIPVLRTLAERLAALVSENQQKIEDFFGAIADWVAEKIPLAMDWLINEGLPAMGEAFQYLSETVFPAIAKAVDWATKNWDALSLAIKILAGVLVTASIASMIAGIVSAIGPLVTLLTGAGGLVASIVGGGGLVAALAAIAGPVGLAIGAVGLLGAAWWTLSRDTGGAAAAMKESADRETKQMALLTGQTFGGWVDSVVAHHRKMKEESGLTLDQMIDGINADFLQMRRDVEAKSGEMSEATKAKLENMRLGAIREASVMRSGVTGEVAEMASDSGQEVDDWNTRTSDLMNEMRTVSVYESKEMKQQILYEMEKLSFHAQGLSKEQKEGILDQLDDLRVQYSDGTTGWREDTVTQMRYLTYDAEKESANMKSGIVQSVKDTATETVAVTGQQAVDVEAEYRRMTGLVADELDRMKSQTEETVTQTVDNSKSTWAAGWDTISNKVSSIAGAIGTTVSDLGDSVREKVSTAISSTSSAWATTWDGISSKASAIAGTIGTVVSGFGSSIQTAISTAIGNASSSWGSTWDTISGKASSVASAIGTVVSGFGSSVQTAIATAIGSASTAWASTWDTISGKASSVASTIGTVVSGFGSSVQTAIATAIGSASTAWATTWDSISSKVSGIASTIGTSVGTLGGNVQSALSGAMSTALSAWGVAWENVRATIGNKAYAIKEAAAAAGQGAVERLQTGWENGTSAFSSAVQRVAGSIKGYFDEKKNDWLTAGRSVIEGVSSGVSNQSSGLFAQMQTLAGNLLGSFKNSLGIRSPSTLFAEAGYNIAAGLAQGIDTGASLVAASLNALQENTELALNQYRSFVDYQLGAAIAASQKGAKELQAQIATAQGFNQEQYAAYWAALQAGESQAAAIAKGQAVKPSAGSGQTGAGAPQVSVPGAPVASSPTAAQQADFQKAQEALAALTAELAKINALEVEDAFAFSMPEYATAQQHQLGRVAKKELGVEDPSVQSLLYSLPTDMQAAVETLFIKINSLIGSKTGAGAAGVAAVADKIPALLEDMKKLVGDARIGNVLMTRFHTWGEEIQKLLAEGAPDKAIEALRAQITKAVEPLVRPEQDINQKIIELNRTIRNAELTIAMNGPSQFRSQKEAELEQARIDLANERGKLASIQERKTVLSAPFQKQIDELEKKLAASKKTIGDFISTITAADVEKAKASVKNSRDDLDAATLAKDAAAVASNAAWNAYAKAAREKESASVVSGLLLKALETDPALKDATETWDFYNGIFFRKQDELKALEEKAGLGGLTDIQGKLQTFVANTLGISADEAATTIDDANDTSALQPYFGVIGDLWQKATGQVADQQSTIWPLIQDMITLVTATATTSVSSLKDEITRLLGFRNTVSPIFQQATGQQSPGTITETNNTFNVTFSGGATNQSVLADIQFLNALYGSA